MPTRSDITGRWAAAAALFVAIVLTAQVAVALAASPETFAAPQVVAQVPTPTPFRFLTPTPLVPGTTTTAQTTAPRAGGFPLELALPVLVGGLVAIGGGSVFLRRRNTR
jgi:hypothetical protein